MNIESGEYRPPGEIYSSPTQLIGVETPLDLASVEAKIREIVTSGMEDVKITFIPEDDVIKYGVFELLRVTRGGKSDFAFLMLSANAPYKNVKQCAFLTSLSIFVPHVGGFYLTRSKLHRVGDVHNLNKLPEFLREIKDKRKAPDFIKPPRKTGTAGISSKSFTLMNDKFLYVKDQ